MGAAARARKDASTTQAAAQAFVGATLGGKYLIERILGVGGMGVVCQARHLQLGKRFAVKLVQRYFAASQIAAARFRREVRAVAAIESEHIVQVTDVGDDPKFGLYMVMELMQGEDLAAFLARTGPVKPIEAARIAHQIARALSKAHAAGILHRDLKPGNIFLVAREDGSFHAKVFDFGISKRVGDAEATGTWNAELTGHGMPVGTPQYMSPEQAIGDGGLDGRTDVWSLGAVLFEMLSGRSPYERGRAQHTLMRLMLEDPPRLESVAPWVPPALCRIVNAALTRDRYERLTSAEAFAHLLEEAMPAAFGRGPTRVRDDDEITVVAPLPSSDPSPPAAPSAITPLAELLEPEVEPEVGTQSHLRLREHTVLTTRAVAKVSRSRRTRVVALAFLAVAIATAVGLSGTGHGATAARARASYTAAPAR